MKSAARAKNEVFAPHSYTPPDDGSIFVHGHWRRPGVRRPRWIAFNARTGHFLVDLDRRHRKGAWASSEAVARGLVPQLNFRADLTRAFGSDLESGLIVILKWQF